MDRKRLIDKYLPVDYSDSITGKSVYETDVDTLFHFMFEDFPGPVRFLLKLRDALVKPFGLKGGTAFREHIIERNENEIIIGMDDRHLGFWVSIYVSDATLFDKQSTEPSLPELCRDEKGCVNANDLEVRTAVRFHNWLGRIYFAGIWCFHKLVVAGVFRRALKRINAF